MVVRRGTSSTSARLIHYIHDDTTNPSFLLNSLNTPMASSATSSSFSLSKLDFPVSCSEILTRNLTSSLSFSCRTHQLCDKVLISNRPYNLSFSKSRLSVFSSLVDGGSSIDDNAAKKDGHQVEVKTG